MQQLFNVIALLEKPGGGRRPIALMGFCYVVLLRIRRPHVQAWDRAYHGPWDKTVGSSAEAAGWLDELESELALHQGFQVAGSLLDLRKFYDSVCLTDLVDAAIELNYPLRLLALALDSYLGARILTLTGCIHKGVLPSGGILPGCGQAVSLSRAF
eukprot:8786906-Pyramimonas_sp.AAC.1